MGKIAAGSPLTSLFVQVCGGDRGITSEQLFQTLLSPTGCLPSVGDVGYFTAV